MKMYYKSTQNNWLAYGLSLLLCLAYGQVSAQTTYDFESMANGATSFTTGGATFNFTGFMIGSKITDLGSENVPADASPSDTFFDSVYGISRAAGTNWGGFKSSACQVFQLKRLDVWPSADAGNNVVAPPQSIVVSGYKNNILQYTETLTSVDYGQSPIPAGGKWQRITLVTNANVYIDEVRLSVPGASSNNYIAVDNFQYANLTVAEINVQGNTTNIADNDVTPDVADHTQFGNVGVSSSLVRTFTIQNTGTATLTINSVLSNNAKFVVGTAPTSITAGSFAIFTVTYMPTAVMTDNATITISNDDCNEGTYDFAIQGAGIASTLQYRTAGNVTFASATNWESSPNGSTWSAAASAPDATANTLAISIQSGHTATVNASITLDQLTVETGGTLVVNGGVELTVVDNVGAGTDLYVNGTLDVRGTNGTINCSGQFELAVGAKLITANENGVTGGAVIDIAGTGTLTWANNTDYVLNGTVPQTANLPTSAIIRNIEINNTNGVIEGQALTFTLSGTLTLTAGTFDISGTGLAVTFTSTMPIANTGTGTIITDGSNVITFGGISGYTIPNKFASSIGTVNVTNISTVTFNQSLTVLNGLNLVAGILNMSGQTLTFDGTTPAILNRTAGTLTVNAFSSITINDNAAGFGFPSNIFTTTPTLNNFIINRAGGVTWNNQDLIVEGTLTLTLGTFDMTGSSITFENGNTPIARTTGELLVTNVNFTGGGTAFTTPAGAFSATPSIGALTINRTNSLAFGDASFTVTGQITLTAGVLDISSKTLILNNSIVEPIANAGTGTITTNAGSILTIRGSGDYTFPSYAFASNTCLGNITVERDGNGTTGVSFTLEGTLTLDNTALTASKVLTFSILTVQNGAVPFASTGAGTFTHGFTVTSSFNIGATGNEGGGVVSLSFVSPTATVNVRRTAGVIFGIMQASSVNIAVGDANIGVLITDGLNIGTGVVTVSDMSVNFIARNTGTLTVLPTSNITFTGIGDVTLPDDLFTSAPAFINNLTINRTNATNIIKWNNQGLLVNGILTLTRGILDISDMSFTNSFIFGGSNTPIVRDGTTQTGTITTGFTTFMGFTGTGTAFTIPNGAFTATPFPIGILTSSRTNELSLGNQGLVATLAVQLTGTGKLNLKGNNIVLFSGAAIGENYADNGVVYDATATDYTNKGGYIEALAPFTFADGSYTSVAGIGLAIEGAATVITNVRRYHYAPSSANMGKGIKRVFDITGTPATGVTDLMITYASSELNGISDAVASNMYISRWTSATGWESFQHNGTNVIFTTNIAPAPNTIEIKDMTTGFSHWTMSSSPAPLPITLLGLKGRRVEGLRGERTEEVRLEWATASEINNKGFEVEMSDNGLAYKKIAFVEGKGNSLTSNIYQLTTIQPNDGYYRLKQIDFDGTFTYSPVVFVEGVAGKVVVYPNPSNGAFAILVGKDKLDLPARLLNAQGTVVATSVATGQLGEATKVVTTGLPAGVYFLHTVVAGKTNITKVVIWTRVFFLLDKCSLLNVP
ncbi:MAG: choice-of-anchor D domain-containing protein [Bacteroidetes bacterium]|nr:MAG: choice-of-anchor D domain-containing protein [Bacteroidota bacterium]